MKKTIPTEITLCDLCGSQYPYATTCMKCGTEMCYDCWKANGEDYNHAVHLQGSGDGHYCKKCDTDLIAAGTDPKHAAYRKIRALREDDNAWRADFQVRAESAKRALESIE